MVFGDATVLHVILRFYILNTFIKTNHLQDIHVLHSLFRPWGLISYIIFNPIRDGGGVQHPLYQKSALRPSKWPPNDPKFRDFSYFYMTYLKSKKIFFGFSQ